MRSDIAILSSLMVLLAVFASGGEAPVAASATNTPLLYMRRAALYGFIDASGKVKVEPAFEDIHFEFSQGRCGVKQNGKWGFIDEQGRLIVRPLYEEMSSFSEGLARVKVDGKWGYIDPTGAQVVKAQYFRATSFEGGLARVFELGDDKKPATCGFIDTRGHYAIKPDFAFAREFMEERAAVNVGGRFIDGSCNGGKWGFIDPKGKQAVEAQYKEVGDFSEGLAAVRLEAQWGYVDKAGQVVIALQFRRAGPFEQGLAMVTAEGGKKLLIDKSGKALVPEKYDILYPFTEDMARVVSKSKYGFIDRTGKEIVPVEYEDAGPFSEGLAAVKKDGAWGYVDKTGKPVLAPQFKTADRFSGGLARVEIFNPANVYYDGLTGYINAAGTNVFNDAGLRSWDYKACTASFEGWIMYANHGPAPKGAGMAMIDISMKRAVVVMPVQHFYRYGQGRQFSLEKAGERILRLRVGDAVGYFDTESGVPVWPPEE